MITLVSLLISLFCVTSPASISIKTTTKALNTSVLLHMKTYPNKKGSRRWGGCSGTYIDTTHILTANHCFDGENVEFIWARGINDKVGYPVHLVRFWSSKDLALLEAPYSHKYAKLGKSGKRGQEILNVGSPYDFEFVVSEGIIAATGYTIKQFTSHYLVTTAMINSGSSGGGVFNDKGELIGVNTMTVGFFGWQGITLAVSIEDVREFLK